MPRDADNAPWCPHGAPMVPRDAPMVFYAGRGDAVVGDGLDGPRKKLSPPPFKYITCDYIKKYAIIAAPFYT